MSVAADVAIEAPFLGLRYFDEEQSHLFFGRGVQVNDILDKLRRSRLVTVMGSSGSGKSSLVRAGVVPSLKAGFLSDAGPRWRIAKMRPGSSPIANLGRELEKALGVPGLDVTLRRGPLGLIQAIEECRLPARENVLVIADQFEELFRYQRESDHADAAKEEAAAFVKLLLEATSQRASPIYVIVTMRSDYLGNCAQFRDLPERINDGLYLVPRMRRDQLEQAITGPVAVEDAAIAPRLVQKLLNDTGDDPDQLPVLQHALLRAWTTWQQAPRPLDLDDLDAVGGMKESLSRHADELFDALSADQQRIARVVFQQLSDRDPEGREIRRPAPVTHIAAVAGATVEAVEEVVRRFAAPDAALLYRNEDGHLDITHESLIRKWRLIQGAKLQAAEPAGRTARSSSDKGWMQEEVEARDQFELLADRTAKNDTLRGRALEEALRWRALGLNADWAKRYAKTAGAGTTLQDVAAFVDACRSEEVRSRRRRQALITGGLLAVAVFLAVIIALWRSAEQQKTVADEAAQSARVALGQASTQEAVRLIGANQPGDALAHLARALRADPDSLAARSWISDFLLNERLWVPGASLQHPGDVSAAAFSPDGRRVLTGGRDGTARVWDAATGRPVGAPMRHEQRVMTAAFSPDGRRVVTASFDVTARIWDAATGQPVGAPLQHDQPVMGAAFSPDGRRVVTASYDKTARLWDADSGQPVNVLLQHQGTVNAAAFSPDGRRIITASDDNTARVWDTATGQPVGAPLRHAERVNTAAFSPDGSRVVTASFDTTARVWDAATGQPVGAPLQHRSPVLMGAFSPDGRLVVTASFDDTARIWDAATGESVRPPFQHQSTVNTATFSPDGRRIVTASSDNTARVWNVSTGQQVGAPLQHQDDVNAAAFSPDGRRVLTASVGTRVWDVATGQPVPPLQHQGDVTAAAFSPDGRRVVTASSDNTARVWDVVTGQPVGAPLQHTARVWAAAFSPDGRRVVTAAFDSTARVWDAATGQPVGAPLRHEDAVRAAAFSSDGRRLVTASGKNARVWDAATGQPVGAPFQHEEAVHAAAFSPDGRLVVTASDDKTARVWDAVTGQAVGAPLQHQHDVNSAAFSPDGRLVVTASRDGTARVWDAATGRPVGAPLKHGDGVRSAAFSPDGRRVVTASFDKTARVWDAVTGQPVGAPIQHTGAVYAAAFSPDGRRVVTASTDKTARVWDAATGRAIGAPLEHQNEVSAAAFSPDGYRVVTASSDRTARVWQVLLDLRSGESVKLLADLAEIVGGYRVTDMGSVVPLQESERLERVRRLAGPDAPAFVPVDVLLRRFLDAPR